MDLEEKVSKREIVYQGNKLNVVVEDVLLPNGCTAKREFVNRRAGAAVLALTEDQQVLVIEKFQHPFEKIVTTLPYGRQQGQETLLETAKRELQEKTGYSALEWVPLGGLMPAPAYSDEVVALFLAAHLQPGEHHWATDEFLNVKTLPLKDFFRLCDDGTILDARTILAAYRLRAYLQEATGK